MTDRPPQLSADEVKDRVSIERVIGAVVALRQVGREYAGLCPFHNEKTASFTVNPDKGFYHCFGCGAHGDVIQFYMQHHGTEYLEALHALAQLGGIAVPEQALIKAKPRQSLEPRQAPPPPIAAAASQQPGQDPRERILKLWNHCQPAAGTPVEAYLRRRCGDLDLIGGVPRSLRYHPSLKHIHPQTGEISYWPAMIGAVQAPAGEIVAIHRTYLSLPDETGRVDKAPKEQVPNAKLFIGSIVTCAVRLAAAGERTGVSEGTENGLAAMIANKRIGRDLPVWAALTLGNIGGGGDRSRKTRPHPLDPVKKLQTEYPDPLRPGIVLPALVRHVTIIGDGDSEPYMTRAIVHRGMRRWQSERRAVDIVWAPPGKDLTDLIGGNA